MGIVGIGTSWYVAENTSGLVGTEAVVAVLVVAVPAVAALVDITFLGWCTYSSGCMYPSLVYTLWLAHRPRSGRDLFLPALVMPLNGQT